MQSEIDETIPSASIIAIEGDKYQVKLNNSSLLADSAPQVSRNAMASPSMASP
jgi:hypothetical protein